MGKANAYVFGLDIGTRSVVGTVGYKKNQNNFTVVAQEVKMHDTRAMLDGQIHDIGKVAETIKQVKRSLEKQIGDKPLTDVCIAAAGRVLKTVTVRAEEVFPEDTFVNEELIHELELKGVEKAYAAIKEATRGEKENYYCVAYTVVRYYLNDFAISNLADHRANKIAADVLATFLPDEVIEGLYTTVEKAGLKVNNLTLEPIAAIMVAIPEKYRMLNIALVDVGAGTSDICVTKDGSITAYGMIPVAGDALTEVIAANHLVEFNVAEEIKLQACTKKKSISYSDIMGLKQKTTPGEVLKEVSEKINEMTKMVAEKIIEMNGGKPVSAVFVVGGGGRITGYTDSLAKALGIPKERVALRGEEVLSFVEFDGVPERRDSTIVTPIGICLNYYENKNNFVYVTLNGDSVKLYDNNRLTVIDAAIAMGYPNEYLFPRRGEAINYTVNGQARMARGELGEASTIKVNGKEASVNTPIEPNDEIKIKKSTVGSKATLEVSRIPEYKSQITFVVDGKKVSCPKFIRANNDFVSGFYEIKNGDKLELLDYYTLSQVLDFLDLPFTDNIKVNNEVADRDTQVYENFKVSFPKQEINSVSVSDDNEAAEKTEQPVEKEEPKKATASGIITVKLNGMPLTMTGKDEFRFVDVLDYTKFDLQNPQGTSVKMTINKKDSAFIDLINDGDELELYWVK